MVGAPPAENGIYRSMLSDVFEQIPYEAAGGVPEVTTIWFQ